MDTATARAAAEAAYQDAKRALALNHTAANLEAVKAAWNAREAVAPPRKAQPGRASRAGQRQAAERRAEQHERNARVAARRFTR